MFEYNARTEVINGAKFIEKDIILFDYIYSGDCLFRVDASLSASGFGFIFSEEEGVEEETGSKDTYLIKINSNDSYTILCKTGDDQDTIDEGFFLSTARVYPDKNVTLYFRKTGEKLLVNKAVLMDDGLMYDEIPLVEYHLPHDIENYKIGLYSNGGNTVSYATVSTEAPSNWITNVFNGNGGRIKWIKNGFTIDESEFDIEAEAENILLPAGTYWFDYETDNPDIKAFVFESYLRDTTQKRSREEIIATRFDEIKNILHDDGSFVLTEDHAVNIRFRGKWGTVKNICIKEDKESDFVETAYGSIFREPGRILFDLKRLKSIQMKATIDAVPKQDLSEAWVYHVFQRGSNTVVLNSRINIGEEISYSFTTSNGKLLVDNELLTTMPSGNILSAFYNVTATITELIVTTKEGREINVLLQKTFKTTLSGQITSPIIVTFKDRTPLELSSSYRKIVTTERKTEIFHGYNPIYLEHYPSMANANVTIYGVKRGEPLYVDGVLTTNRTKINYTPTKRDLLHKTIGLTSDIKLQYHWIIVTYNAITDTKYMFTPWERELFDLEEDKRVYLEHLPLQITGNMVVYGIKGDDYINKDLIYYIPSAAGENTVNLCSYEYTQIPSSKYRINAVGKVIFDAEAVKDYKYLIIDYLKQNVYSVNHQGDYWEVEISSLANDFIVMYDSKDGLTTEEFHLLNIDDLKIPLTANSDIKTDIEEGDFVVLEAGT